MNAKRSYEEVAAEVELISDLPGKPVDELIKPLVIGLMMHGAKTTASCEGHLDHGKPYPWVTVSGESIHLLGDLVGRQNRPVLKDGQPNENQWVLQPAPGGAFWVIPQFINRPLSEMQSDSIKFGEFLKEMPE